MPAVAKARSAAVGGALCCSGTLWCITPWGSQILTYVMHVVCYIRSETEEFILHHSNMCSLSVESVCNTIGQWLELLDNETKELKKWMLGQQVSFCSFAWGQLCGVFKKRLQSVALESRRFPQVTNQRPVLRFFFFFLFVCLFITNTTHSLTLNYVEPFCHLQQYVAQLSCRYSELRLLNGADLTGISGGLFTYFFVKRPQMAALWNDWTISCRKKGIISWNECK